MELTLLPIQYSVAICSLLMLMRGGEFKRPWQYSELIESSSHMFAKRETYVAHGCKADICDKPFANRYMSACISSNTGKDVLSSEAFAITSKHIVLHRTQLAV